MTEASGNGRNGLFLKVLVGVNVTLMVAGIGGGIKLYRDVGVLQVGSQLDRRVDRLEDLAANIARDRDQRTAILAEFRARLERLERKVFP